MTPKNLAISLAAALLLTACSIDVGALQAAFNAETYETMEKAEAVPAGHVLVIGRVAFDPPVQQKQIHAIWSPGAPVHGRVSIAATNDLSEPLNLNVAPPLSPDEGMSFSDNGTSFLPMPPGTRYLRYGDYMISHTCAASAVMTGCRHYHSEQIEIIGDVELNVPDGASAVYVGTIVYRHDGERTTGVSVRDDFRTALRDLDALGIPGINSSNVMKRLARAMPR